jgi:hypothetical protein
MQRTPGGGSRLAGASRILAAIRFVTCAPVGSFYIFQPELRPSIRKCLKDMALVIRGAILALFNWGRVEFAVGAAPGGDTQ